MVNWRRLTGVTGLAAGAVAAGAGAVIMAEKIAVGRIRLRPDPAAGEPFGNIRGEALTVTADDGLPLHVEVSGPPDAPVTIIFCHGYTLNQTSGTTSAPGSSGRAAVSSGTSAATAGPAGPTPTWSASTSSAPTCTRS